MQLCTIIYLPRYEREQVFFQKTKRVIQKVLPSIEHYRAET